MGEQSRRLGKPVNVMKHEEILASLAVLALSGVLVYLTKVGAITINTLGNRNRRIAGNQVIAANQVLATGGDPASLLSGPAIYVSQTPWPFGPNVGNTLPPTSAGVTLPGANQADFLGFATA